MPFGPFIRKHVGDRIRANDINELQAALEQAGPANPDGGRTFQPLIKATDTDQDTRWDPVPKSIPLHQVAMDPSLGASQYVTFGPGSHGVGATGQTLDDGFWGPIQYAAWFDGPVSGATVDQVSIRVPSAQAGGVIYAYLYDDENSYPKNLVEDLGSVATDTSGTKTIAISPDLELVEGQRYWIVTESNAPSNYAYSIPVTLAYGLIGKTQNVINAAAGGSLIITRSSTPIGAIADFTDAGYSRSTGVSTQYPMVTFRSNRP